MEGFLTGLLGGITSLTAKVGLVVMAFAVTIFVILVLTWLLRKTQTDCFKIITNDTSHCHNALPGIKDVLHADLMLILTRLGEVKITPRKEPECSTTKENPSLSPPGSGTSSASAPVAP